jgi:arsenate reductase
VSLIRVLFLCTGNSARSILAEALLKRIGGSDFSVVSAGTHPKGLNPYTAAVLRKMGLDPEGFRSKPVSDFEGEPFDYVITVCDQAAEACPVFSGAARRLHWSFPDPAAVEGSDLMKLTAFEETARGLRERIETFVPAARHSAEARA